MYEVDLVVVDRLLVAQYYFNQNKAMFWLRAQLLRSIIEQLWGDTRIYNAKDAGKALGCSIQLSILNLSQSSQMAVVSLGS